MPARKRKQTHDEAETKASKPTKTPRSTLGGMKGGDPVDETEAANEAVVSFSIPLKDSKSISCERRGVNSGKARSLIFTHGAGGGISNPATVGFAEGYSTSAEVICFQGPMNLKSRVESFATVVQHKAKQDKQKGEVKLVVGGRSMGARAAVMTASANASDDIALDQLILVSYPLKGSTGEIRDQILLELDASKRVLFISGSNDHMCSIQELNKIRSKMKAQTWLVVVEGADHGMSLKGKAKEQAAAATRKMSGELAAAWVAGEEGSELRERSIAWDGDKQKAVVRSKLGKAGAEGTRNIRSMLTAASK